MRRIVAPCYDMCNQNAMPVCSKMLPMKTKQEIRYQNLVDLCAKHGGPLVLGSLASVSGDNLRQVIARTKTPSGTERGVGDTVARAIEDALRLGRGWMDQERASSSAAEDPREYTTLKHFDVSASLGSGVVNQDYVSIKDGLMFKRSFLEEETIEEKEGQVIYAEGDSMLPTLPSGSVVLINRGDITPRHGKVFLILDRDDGLRIKRLIRSSDGWTIRSDNDNRRAYPDEQLDEDRHAILGRAAWFGSRL